MLMRLRKKMVDEKSSKKASVMKKVGELKKAAKAGK